MAYTVKAVSGVLRNYYRKYPGTKPRLDKGRSFTDPAEAERRRLWLEENVEGRAPRLEATAALDALDEFVKARPLAPRTLVFYRVALGAFFRRQGRKALAEWEPRDLESWVRGHPDWAPRTTAIHVRACRLFVKWARKRKIAVGDFASMVEIPRQVSPDVGARTVEEADAVIAEARRTKDALLPALGLARYAGFPIADFRAATWAEARFDLGEIHHTRSKTGVYVELPIAEPLREILTLDFVRATHGPICRGLAESDRHLIVRLHELERSVGVHAKPREGFHAYRRTYGTALASLPGITTGDINYLMMHKPGSVESLKYVKVNRDSVREAIRHGARAVGGTP